MEDKFRIGFKARLKHGVLLEALAKMGWNQSRAAKYFGVSPSVFGHWINLQGIPANLTEAQVAKFVELTGQLPEQLWPEYVRSRDFLDAPKTFEVVKDVDARRMLAALQFRRELSAAPPDELFEKKELKRVFGQLFHELPPKIAEVLRRRFYDDETLEEVGKAMNVSGGRIRKLEAWGLRSLRHPSRSRKLRSFF